MDMKALLYSTELQGRRLWFDGDSTFNVDNILFAMQKHEVRYVNEITPQVVAYNRNVLPNERLTVKTECKPLTRYWTIPDDYKTMDMIECVFDRHDEMVGRFPEHERTAREQRLAEEMCKYQEFGFNDVLRAITYVINTLTDHKQIWGVGRGSSVSSYVLFVLGVHDVDSFKYELDIDDFLHQ